MNQPVRLCVRRQRTDRPSPPAFSARLDFGVISQNFPPLAQHIGREGKLPPLGQLFFGEIWRREKEGKEMKISLFLLVLLVYFFQFSYVNSVCFKFISLSVNIQLQVYNSIWVQPLG